ncbi:pectinesterase 3-like [Punica granatum]|uniref:Pectinesterase n=2 Tax=Punica granatum TaxID=22663 RepID=A0A2I0L5Y9_PUNGR|nr:pectinesterase 3-like [Punica granatum]PKI76023.1 hypothetical protein CRG98_003573 [Punica granatum]
MDSCSTFKSCGKAEKKLEEQDFCRKTRNRIVVISISMVLLISLIVGIAVGVSPPGRRSTGSGENPPSYSADYTSISSMCNVTLYPNSCFSSISSVGGSSNVPAHLNLEGVFKLSLQVALGELVNVSSLPRRLMSSTDNYNVSFNSSDPLTVQALHDCGTLFDHAIGQVKHCIAWIEADLEVGNSPFPDTDSIRTWLSTAITDQKTCQYGLMEARNGSELADFMKMAMKNSMEFTSNSLAIASHVLALLGNLRIPSTRKLLTAKEPKSAEWISKFDWRLMLAGNPKPDLIVAKDDSGNFSTISEALASVPKRTSARTVIYIKKGVYVENVTVGADLWNVMMYGDGMRKTVISGSKNYVDGTPTYSSATFGADGRGFIAKDIGFENTAGPEKFQAVALRSSADQSVFYRCFFDAYQDTLFTHAGRQFYRDCLIIGTIDFIFGNSAAVFQNCRIQPRQPMPGQFNGITAQGKSDPNQNTGISIQHCQIRPFDNLTAQTFLGRPWEDYSTTVYMRSDIDGFINPMGWAQWIPNLDPPSTIFYAEYQNTGPGSEIRGRVSWAGFRHNISEKQAVQFSVESFIQGNKWLPKANVLYDL